MKSKLQDSAELFFFDMDTKRLPKGQHPAQALKAMKMIDEVHPDVVVVTDDNALMFLGRSIQDLHIPIVYLGINANPRCYLEDMTGVTGVLERPLMKRSIAYLRELFAEQFDKCLVMFDDSSTAQAVLETTFYGHRKLSFAGTETEVVLTNSFTEWEKRVSSAKEKGYDAIIVGLYHTIRDDAMDYVDPDTVLTWTAAHTPVPIFGFWDFTIGEGKAIGGLIHFGEDQGKAAAQLVLSILNGADPRQVQPVTAEQGRFIFSRHELKRWGIELPDDFARGSEIIFVD
ncbi:ABC transporter substrate-binding protein [Salidesulfovibrio onnuriiensis]|uniref:ABC transporter substrate-binding protein n=1 Tax=Salidesulfovibrio onnuriiensis TaxID=2583823 RepID=UPI00164F30C4|nr:ABC transporter substrate binding protein [Salidesulfovibrio onnuriiensis]